MGNSGVLDAHTDLDGERPPKRSVMEKKGLSVFVGICTVGVTLLLWWLLVTQDSVQIERTIQQAGEGVTHSITTRLESQISALDRLANRWESRGGTPRVEW